MPAVYHVDAFADRPFAGNPAGVVLLDEPGPDGWMAAVAAEINLSETAFTWPLGQPGRWGLRWWTPTAEVPLCGHATLATALVLAAEGEAPAASGAWTFASASGDLVVRPDPDGGGCAMDFPAYDRRELTPAEADAVGELLAVPPVEVCGYGPKVLAALPQPADVEGSTPDTATLAAVSARWGWEGLLTTAATADGYVLRYFAPAVGVPEDPVTGSAQCAAGPYWTQRSGRAAHAAVQVSARRGELDVTVGGDGRVRIAGRGVIVWRGELLVGP